MQTPSGEYATYKHYETSVRIAISCLTIFQLETFESRFAETEEKRKNAESNLNECKASWEEQKNLHKAELEKLVSRCEELTSQNALLHEQGEKVSCF